jgi:serine/threonine protein kinase
VLLAEDWSVKICDFGLSRYQTKFEQDNHGKIGTPHWMAPEILRGEKYTEEADVYSFGVILWEMLCGEIPFMGRSHAQITGVVGYYQESLQIGSQYNSDLRKVCHNCLKQDASRRPTFETIIEFISRKLPVENKRETVAP